MSSAFLKFARLGAMAVALCGAVSCGDDERRGSDASMNACTPACSAGSTCCEGRCTNTSADPANCGRCGNECMSGVMCGGGTCGGMPIDSGVVEGNCIPTCSAAQRCCGDACVNRMVASGVDGTMDSSFDNCGRCGNTCDPERANQCGVPTGMSGEPDCLCGNFRQCAMGQSCVMMGSSYLCVDFNTDENNCGMPGNRCGAGESCVTGMCGCGATGAGCPEGTGCCNGSCVDITEDPENCGMCGQKCGEHAPQCVEGACTCAAAGRACVAPGGSASGADGGGLGFDAGISLPPIGGSEPGESCCESGCVANTNESCGCGVVCDEMEDEECVVGGTGGIFGMGGEPRVCCSDMPSIPFFDPCGGGGGIFGDGGLPFGDTGIPFP